MKRLRLDPEAEAAQAAEWYEERCPGLGLTFLGRVRETTQAIREGPESFPLVVGLPDDAIARLAHVRKFPYRLVFTELPDELRVVAVAHDRRRRTYWLDRL